MELVSKAMPRRGRGGGKAKAKAKSRGRRRSGSQTGKPGKRIKKCQKPKAQV